MLIIYFVGVVLWIAVGAVLTETHDQEWGDGILLGVAIILWPVTLAVCCVVFMATLIWECGRSLGMWIKNKGWVK